MRLIKNIPFWIIVLLLSGCIKSYTPQIESSAENKYVVSGRVTDQEGWQEVDVSLSSPIGSPKHTPVSQCTIQIFDDKGNGFALTEFESGHYRVWMNQADLVAGNSYRVQVLTPGGETLESGYDRMYSGATLDSVYYSINDVPTSNPEITSTVMQFYVDLNAKGNYSQYYLWEIEETWQYEAAHPAEYYYDGEHHQIKPPDYSNKVCWITLMVNNVFTIATTNLSQNTFNKYPLHFIDGTTSRLGIMYSMMVRQLGLSEAAYNYWEQLRINSNEQGGLYEKQPLAIKGNLTNLTNPGKDVLGYFYAASMSSRRYFYHDVEGIDLRFYNFCSEEPLGRFGWKEFFKWEYPVYYYFNEVGALRTLNMECIDCRKLGGKTVKPDYWPK